MTYDVEGHLLSIANDAGTKTYTLDALGLPLSVATTYVGLTTQTIDYTYNPDGSRASMATPAGSFYYNYDAVHRMTSLTNPDGRISSWQYQNNGWLAQQTLGNGAVTNYTRDALGRLTSVTNLSPDSTLRSSFTGLTYDGLDNRTQVTATIAGLANYSGTTTYTYGTMSRLLGETSTRNGGYTFNNAYDNAGNPTTFRGQSATYNNNNQHTGAGYAYDGNGNPTLYRNQTLSFDPEDRLTAFGTVLTAGYTGDNLRAWKQTAQGRTYYLYDDTQPVCEVKNTGSETVVTAFNTFGPTGLLGRHEIGGREIWYHFDNDGNVAQRMNELGTVLSTDLYDAWGNVLAGGDVTDPFGYKGQAGYYNDYETGLTLCTYRYYDHSTGQWLNRDKIFYDGGNNLYEYCDNDPVNSQDPLGLRATNDEGVDIILSYEGFSSKAYHLDQWTIGYGTTMVPAKMFPKFATAAQIKNNAYIHVQKGMTICEADARTLFRHDLEKFERMVENAVSVPLNDNQFSALVSLHYNCNSAFKSSSTLMKALAKKDYAAASNAILLYDKATIGGKTQTLKGLTKRRTSEKSLFDKPV